LKEVIDKKHGTQERSMPPTTIICRVRALWPLIIFSDF
jgi:hypothetical protein